MRALPDSEASELEEKKVSGDVEVNDIDLVSRNVDRQAEKKYVSVTRVRFALRSGLTLSECSARWISGSCPFWRSYTCSTPWTSELCRELAPEKKLR
jgi:hypothetical protein